MKNTKWLILLLVFTVGMGKIAFAQTQDKIAFVDVAEVFDKYEKTKEADKKLTDSGKNKQALRDSYVQEVRRLQDELAVVSNDKKTEKQEQIDKKIRELQQFDDGVRKELRDQRDGVVKQIIADIDNKVAALGKKGGYDFIINSRLLLFKSDKYDITQQVLTELNKEYKS
jgi:Skp family chaperone for outer membrane proteins